MQSESTNFWDVFEDGAYFPTRVVNGEKINKPKEDWSDDDRTLVFYNYKAMHILFCAFSRDQFNMVQQCQNSHGILLRSPIREQNK